MKLRNFLSMGVLSVLALGACTPNADDNSEWNDGTQPVSFTSSIQGVKSRAANNAWDTSGNDEIGIFTKKSGAFDAVNKHYGVSAAGALASKSAEDAIYYPTDGSKVDFVAYYPYASVLTNNTYAVNLSDQSNQSKIDLLYSKNATQKDNTVTAPVQLTFTHQLAKVVLNITRDATIPTLAGLQVSVSGTNRKASFDLLNGQLSSPTDMADIAMNVKEDGSLAEAIILPVNALTGGKISFTLNGKTQTWNIPVGQNYAAGSQYTYPVTIKETGGQISVTFGDAAITDWTAVAGGNIDIDFGNGGGEVDPPTPGGEEKTIFKETFESGSASAKPLIAAFTGWDNKAPIVYSDEFGKSSVRNLASGTNYPGNNVWIPNTADASFKISGIDVSGYTSLKLKVKLLANVYAVGVDATNLNKMQIKWNGLNLTVPSVSVTCASETDRNYFHDVEITGLADATVSSLEFFVPKVDNAYGFRLDNVELVGKTK